jgi:hypothetical protein
MVQTPGTYPVYSAPEKYLSKKVKIILDYEQVLEIANALYYLNTNAGFFARKPKLTTAQRALHKSIHDCAINVCLSLELEEEIKDA